MHHKNKVDIKIDEDVKKSATQCEKDFKCLVDKTYEFCKVTEAVHDKVIFVKCLEENYCTYKMGYGYSHTCNCPIRKDLYKKHKI